MSINTGGDSSPGGAIPDRYRKNRPFDLPYAPYNPVKGTFHTPYRGVWLVEIKSEVDPDEYPGLYRVAPFMPNEGDEGMATELNGSTGIGTGTRVVCHKATDEKWYFFFPVSGCV